MKIIHPTPSILLPVHKAANGSIPGEMWELKALGGSGYYVWESYDPLTARISERSQVWSVNEGATYLKVSDLHNEFNYATILVEVEPVYHMTWLETRVETLMQKETSLLSLIALDVKGRKFTNCTILNMRYEITGDGVDIDEPLYSDWTSLQEFVHSRLSFPLIKLRKRFENDPQTVFGDDLQPEKDFTPSELEIMRHNNFGICDQVRVKAKNEGLSRVKAYFDAYYGTVESDKAEVGSFQHLDTMNPDYPTFLSSLYSKQQTGQEFQTF